MRGKAGKRRQKVGRGCRRPSVGGKS
jgi:hypothetical protein